METGCSISIWNDSLFLTNCSKPAKNNSHVAYFAFTIDQLVNLTTRHSNSWFIETLVDQDELKLTVSILLSQFQTSDREMAFYTIKKVYSQIKM